MPRKLTFVFECNRSCAPEHGCLGLRATYKFSGTLQALNFKKAIANALSLNRGVMAAIPGVYELKVSRGDTFVSQIVDTRPNRPIDDDIDEELSM